MIRFGPVFWLLVCLALSSLRASPIQQSVIQDVRVLGTARPVKLKTKAGQLFDADEVARDVRRLWASGKFADIRVEAVTSSQGLVLAFKIVEKRSYSLRKIEFAPQRFHKKVEIEEGDKFDDVRAQKLAANLRRQLVEEGYSRPEVKALLIPIDARQADLHVKIRAGQLYRVQKVHFSGQPGLRPQKLQKALRANHVKRVFPGIPGLWKGWQLHPPFSERRLIADLAQLRALYISKGYLSPNAAISKIEYSGKRAEVTIEVHSGPQYGVHEVEVVGSELHQKVERRTDGDFPQSELCRCLQRMKLASEMEGKLDFEVYLQIQPKNDPSELAHSDFSRRKPKQARMQNSSGKDAWVSLKASVSTGRPYRVGRIEFHGDDSVNDLTLRRAMTIDEADLFDWGKVRQSVAHLNRLEFIDPVTEEDLRVVRHPDDGLADLLISVRGTRRGRWSFSGPAGPLTLFGPLHFSLGSRLPNWGKKTWEVSTYYLNFSLFPFPQALTGPDSIDVETKTLPLVALSRPYLPGQGWRSGFTLSPQLGWKDSFADYGFTQMRELGLAARLPTPGSEIIAPVGWVNPGSEEALPISSATGALVCERPKPSLGWARSAEKVVLDWLPLLPLFL